MTKGIDVQTVKITTDGRDTWEKAKRMKRQQSYLGIGRVAYARQTNKSMSEVPNMQAIRYPEREETQDHRTQNQIEKGTATGHEQLLVYQATIQHSSATAIHYEQCRMTSQSKH